MLRDVFYYGKKPNVHPREKFAKNLEEARTLSRTEHFWIINEFCDYKNFDWDFDFETLPDDEVWTEKHNNVWPSQHQKDSGTWLCPKKFSDVLVYRNDVDKLKRKKERHSCWIVNQKIDESTFDFSWHPDPTDPPYIYVWGNQWYSGKDESTIEYRVPEATEYKYMDKVVMLAPDMTNWQIFEEFDTSKFDFSWKPSPKSPPYIYAWGNQWNKPEDKVSVQYTVPGAIEYKYMFRRVKRLPDRENWVVPMDVDSDSFDFSWVPGPEDQPYVYQFGTQHQKTGGPKYLAPGVTQYSPTKYVDRSILSSKRLPNKDRFNVVNDYVIENFDWSWHPDLTEEAYTYVFGNQFYPPEVMPTVEYKMPGSTQLKYIHDFVATLGKDMRNWEVPDYIDESSFDFSWKPDPNDPPYIYEFATVWHDRGGPRYTVPGATQYKYITDIKAKLKPHMDGWEVPSTVDMTSFDWSWRPHPDDPPYIYEFATQWHDRGGPKYVTPYATEYKYITDIKAKLLPSTDNWYVPEGLDVSEFDFSWRPHPDDPPLMYQFGTQWQKTGGPMYVDEAATDIKYVDVQVAKRLPSMDNWIIPDDINVDLKQFDFSWHPDDTEDPYIYHFGTQWQKTGGPIYTKPGATQVKYEISQQVKAKPNKAKYIIPKDVDVTKFDFSWHPDITETGYNYQFGTQWQKTGGPTYVVEGATDVKYVTDQKAIALPTTENWTLPKNLDTTEFDFSWHPDDTSPAHIYHFATQWAMTGGPIYTVPGATSVKYMDFPMAKALEDRTNWEIPEYIDSEKFDFSWHPYVEDQPYIYVFGTQHQKSGGPRYHTPGSDSLSPVKYIDRRILKATRLPDKTNFKVLYPIDEDSFDWSWHPDETEDPYIYVFGNQHWSAEKMPTVEYHVPGATQIKYVNHIKAKLLPNKDNWRTVIPLDESKWDYSWVPDPGDPAYIYVFGNQWNEAEIESTIEYHVPEATEKKYINEYKATVLPDKTNFVIIEPIKEETFDFSWRPNPFDPAYIYVFGNNLYPAEEMSTVEYRVEGATEKKYINDFVAQLAPDRKNWKIPKDVDVTGFDFSWKPSPGAPPYIYEFGTQWQKTGGPRYVVKGAKEVNYVDTQKVKRLPTPDDPCWVIPEHVDTSQFDFSWHPDSTEPVPYIYQFGTQWALSGGPKYVVPKAKQIKYIDSIIATAKPNKENWVVPDDIDESNFDFSWHPYAEDKPFIYQFGTQWQKTGGPKYVTPGSDSMTPVKYIDRRILKSKRLPVKTDNWIIPSYIDETSIDYSWHPDDTEQPYIYHFGTQWHDRGGPLYKVEGATQVKYLKDIKAKIKPSMENWEVPDNIEVDSFDFSWRPHPQDPPYIYKFGTQWHDRGGPIYRVEGAVDVKYVEEPVATTKPNRLNWKINRLIDESKFDFSWVPHPNDPPYIYQFPTQWQKTGGPQYVVEGATQVKYVDKPKAIALPDMTYWIVPDDVDTGTFDFSWHPDDTEEPFIYKFGSTQYSAEIGSTIQYKMPGAIQTKYVHDIVARFKIDMKHWYVPDNIDTKDFDFSWKPDPNDPPFIYQFGTQWQKTGGPRYTVEGATQIKYIEVMKAKALPTKLNWYIEPNAKIEDFDYSWHPDDTDEPYNYVFGNKFYSAEKMPTVTYKVPGATKTKFVKDIVATLKVDTTLWHVPDNIDAASFDFSWIPDPGDDPYIYQFGTQWQKTGGPQYRVPGAATIKYISDVKAKAIATKENWQILDEFKIKDFDYSWHPDTTEEPYIYVFGNNHYPAEIMPTIQYVVPGANKKKYVKDIVATLLSSRNNWQVPEGINVSNFDFSWLPDPKAPPYIYQFGTQHQKTNGPRYVVPGATEIKYVEGSKAIALPRKDNWKVIEGYKIKTVDYSWHPDSTEQPYIYVFGTKYHDVEKMPVLRYEMPGATQVKYVKDITVTLEPTSTNWVIPDNVDVSEFDFGWTPDPGDDPYIYQFGTQWQKTGGPRYVVKDATDIKYVEQPKAIAVANMNRWEIAKDINTDNFDFSWHPDETAPPVIYQFGTLENDNNGPRYVVPGNDGEIVRLLRVDKQTQGAMNVEQLDVPKYYITTTLEDLIELHKDEIFWALNTDIDYSNFDFNWRPSIEQARYIHAFGTKENINTQTYFVSAKMYMQGYRDINYVEGNNELRVLVDMFLVDKGNPEATERFNKLKEKFGSRIQKTRYLNSWVDTINRCINRSSTNLCWILNSELDYTDFDFDWYPDPWQLKMVHVFGTQWNHWGNTYMVNRDSFPEDTKYIKIIEHLNNLNFVKTKRAIATNNLYDIYLIDHGNKEIERISELLKYKSNGKQVNTVPYEGTYLKTIKKIVDDISPKKEHHIWLCSSICNYSEFDFSYVCDPFAKDNLHVFPSNNQKFGDTFLLDVVKTKELIDNMQVLQQYHKVNYNSTLRVKRLPAPVIISEGDTHVESVKKPFDFPYAIFVTQDNKDIAAFDQEPMSLWDEESKTIISTSTGSTRIIVPKEARDIVKNELYDYPYIKTASKLVNSKPLDIVFLSNGEKNAEENYEHLLAVTKGLKNRIVRVDGVNGRVEAYHASAQASKTPWAFTVFAKLKVNPKFDWEWQPDRLQQPKHYIFHAKNPVNGLEYGHQGMIAYNKNMVLNNWGEGLDFTLDDLHETVEILSGTAEFNTDAYASWRTAFREVIKLKSDYTEISQERLGIWLTKAKGKFAKDCLQGAQDAVEYYESVSGDIEQLKLSYEWSWLKAYYDKKYK